MYDVLEKAPDTLLPATTTRVLPAIRWRLGTRIAFRFCAAYFTLYVLATQMIGSLLGLPATLQCSAPAHPDGVGGDRPLWIRAPLVIQSGSGDKPFDWALAFSLLVIASGVTVVWSLVDRSRASYARCDAWFRLFLRLSVGATMISYGMAKAIPLQMPFPEPVASARALWTLFADGRALGPGRRIAGLRALHGLRRVERRNPPLHTWLGAAWRCRVAVWRRRSSSSLNMTYDVPVKLFSLHLVADVAAAPRAGAQATVERIPAEPRGRTSHGDATRPASARQESGRRPSARARRLAVYTSFTGSLQARARFGPAAPKPPLYGIWDIETMAIDGQVRSP